MKKIAPERYTKEFFFSQCEGWNYWKDGRPEKISPRLKYALSLVPLKKGMMALDFGCGRGDLSFFLAQKGVFVYAVDYAEAAIKILKKTRRNLTREIQKNILVQKRDEKSLKMKNNSLDLIFFIDVFEHLTDGQLRAILKKFFNFLKPGGKLIIHTAPNKKFLDVGYPKYTRWANFLVNPFWQWLFKERKPTLKNARQAYDSSTHINEQTKESLEKWLLKFKFKTKVWEESSFHLIRFRDKINYLLLMPIWCPWLKKYFSWDIWAIGEKPK